MQQLQKFRPFRAGNVTCRVLTRTDPHPAASLRCLLDCTDIILWIWHMGFREKLHGKHHQLCFTSVSSFNCSWWFSYPSPPRLYLSHFCVRTTQQSIVDLARSCRSLNTGDHTICTVHCFVWNHCWIQGILDPVATTIATHTLQGSTLGQQINLCRSRELTTSHEKALAFHTSSLSSCVCFW